MVVGLQETETDVMVGAAGGVGVGVGVVVLLVLPQAMRAVRRRVARVDRMLFRTGMFQCLRCGERGPRA